MTAIVIGDRAGLDEEVQRRLRAAGTYHVIAISGGNVALLTGVSFVLLRWVVRSFRLVALATVLVVVVYGSVVTGEASVERAVLAACIYLVLSLIGLRSAAVQVVAVTALLLVVVHPFTVLDAGAWLSFGATFGIIVGANRFTAWAARMPVDASTGGRLIPERPRIVRRLWLFLLGLFASTLMAELVLAPVSAVLFSRVGVLGLVLNFVAIPAMAVVQFGGFAMLACHGWCPAGAELAGRIVATAGDWLVGSAAAVDSAPWLIWRVPPVSLLWILIYYAGLGVAIWWRGQRRTRRLSIAIGCLALIAIITAPGLESAAPDGRLRVTMLDVGQGDAIVVQFPDRHTLLIDAGGVVGAADFGGRVITPALWGLGVRRLDWLAITHPDLDHIGGAAGTERDFQPKEIWEAVPVPPNPELVALHRNSQARRIAWRQVLAGHRLEIGSVVMDAVHPPAPDWERRRVRNDDSMVLRVRFGGVEFLFTGDAGSEFEERFVTDPPWPIRILKVGHHGSKSSSSMRFLDTVRPQVALISAGRANLFGHPAPEVLQRLESIAAKVFRTDRDGAIIIETDGANVTVMTMAGETWRCALPIATPPPVRP
jgi:competence protein ComEC